MSRRLLCLGVMAAVLVTTACERSKSSNPLSPSVAGPIPGVSITAPAPVLPALGAKVPVDQQPLTLVVNNASTTGVRPLTYVFEVATDVAFSNKVYSKDSIAPGSGTTSLKLPEALATGRTYYWRAQAVDGANTGDYSAVASVSVFTPIVINTPTPVSPVANAKTADLHPQFVFKNASRSGPVGDITYTIEVSTSDAFSNKTVWRTAESANQTTFTAPQDFAYSTQYFWHVRAADATTIGAWSATATFTTLDAPPPPVIDPIPVPPVVTGPAPNDQMNLGLARVYNSPIDVAAWSVTAKLQELTLAPSGVHVVFDKQATWPEVTPPGWDGPLQYTLWIVINVNGQWYTSGCIEFWKTAYENGGPVDQYARNWYYDAIRWGNMVGHQPAPGEQVGFFVTAGDARNNGPFVVKERSQVVVISFPTSAGATFRF